jgi:FeS assembly SUF system regulator
MLRISKLADYGTVVMAVIAREPAQGLSAKTLANKTHVSLPTVSKLLKRLTQYGLLISQRGAKGGYRLSKPAKDISLTDILMAVDGDLSLTECSHGAGLCTVEEFCVIRHNWQMISHMIKKSLGSIYLSQIAYPFKGTNFV